MKRWVLYAVVLLIFSASPLRGTDIGKLTPVEVVWLAEKDGQVYLECDTTDAGWGESVQAALEDMKAAALGTIFLETADYLIVEQGQEALLEQINDLLRPSCKVCVAQSKPDWRNVSMFLNAHEPQVTLQQYRVEKNALPVLREEEGRFEWVAQ